MSIDPITAPDRESLEALEQTLAGMMCRLETILSKGALTEEGLVEITAIYNNVAYIFLYLEANEEHVRYDGLLPWRDAFHDNPGLDEKVLRQLVELRCEDPEAEESRLAYVAQLRDKAEAAGPVDDRRAVELQERAKAVLAEVQQAQLRFLRRVGAPTDTNNPSAVFYRLVSGTPGASTRHKLTRVWTATRDSRRDELVAIVDEMVRVRREQSHAAGHPSVIDQALTKCGVPADEAEAFIARYLRQALVSQDRLVERVREAIETEGDPLEHFGFYMRQVTSGARAPLFLLDECLAFIFDVARSVFGLDLRTLPSGNSHVITVEVTADDRPVGQINFDLWNTAGKTVGANHTKGLRNRTDWSNLVQHPVAYVSCRFQQDEDRTNRITFQNVHSLFHEFGHALNHLLIRKRISNRSGLEYLPLERLEHLSMFFEKWVYHPAFARSLSLDAQDRAMVRVCQRIKALEYQRTYVERAVTAALDFEVHRRDDGGLAEAYAALEERFGISRHCTLGDFPMYFTWPMFQANPGANFAYLYGASDSVEKFLVFEPLTLVEVAGRPELREMFASSLDFSLPTATPDSDAVFAFYDRLAADGISAEPVATGEGALPR
ncbi:M3 family metallopeptidase [Micromonospora tarensis]|uniref:Peptidase M3A/M3B catalytic domain-containing protein n=1 Tax=Micromonospora tarensis TaxID=2806100 RepID=A0ABS1YDB8_9ACTN|nr:M3 family metallopeptidase [Micromonospora tarensis]MBM0275411.1 hypothetical protein [Micromonospora tarensis]